MRLIVPYLLALLLFSSVWLSYGSAFYASLAVVQAFVWAIALISLRYKIPLLDRVAAPAGALLILNAAAVVGLYKFLFTRGPLWKIWNTGKPVETTSRSISENKSSVDHAIAATVDAGKHP
jgi:hypothetical protein